MERFFPSEVARLILGFLKDINCTKTWETFMKECPHLQEYYQLYKDGEVYSTNVGGKSLSEILHEYCKLKSEARDQSTSQNQSFETSANTSNPHVFKTPRKTSSQLRVSSARYSDTTSCNSQVPSTSRGPQIRSSTGSIHPTHNKSHPNFDNLSSPSTHKSFQSDPSRRLHFAKADKAKPSPLYPHPSPSTICSDDESVVCLDSYLHGEQDAENSSVRSVTLVASDNFTNSNVNSPYSSVYETAEAPSEDHQASDVNRSVVLQSAEVSAVQDGLVFATSSFSLTPHRSLNPPSYHRAPNTNSPRIILSYDRSQVSSLTTPLKKGWRDDLISPRRKSIPRRRLLNDSPLPKATIEYPLNALHDDLESILEEFFTQQPLAQKIADNINKIKDHTKIPEAQGSDCLPLQDVHASEGSAQNTLHETEGAIAVHSNVSMDSNRYRDDMNSTREPVSHPIEVTGHTKEPEPSMPGCSLLLPESAPIASSSLNRETPSSQPPESIARPETDSVSNATPTPNEVQPTAPDVSGRESEDQPMDVVDCDGRSSSALNCSQAPEEPTENNAEESGRPNSQPGLSKSKIITEVTIGTPFNIETQMVGLPGVASEATPQPSKGSTPSNTDPSFNAGAPVSSTPLNVGVSNTTVAANLITLPNGNISIIPAMPNSFYQTPTFVQLPYPASYILPSSGPGSIQYSYFNVLPSPSCQDPAKSGVHSEAPGEVQTVTSATEGAATLNQSPLKIPADYSPMKSLWSGSILQSNSNVGSYVTVSSDKKSKKKKKANAFDVSDSPISKKNIEATDPNVVVTSNSHEVIEASSSPNIKEKEQDSPHRKRTRQKRVSLLKPLFPSPPKKKDVPNTVVIQNVTDDQIPVISIPDPSPYRDHSQSAYEILQGIAGFTNTTGKTEQSPILKTLISSAKHFTGDGGIISATCVRTLNFGSPAKDASKSLQTSHPEIISSQENVKPDSRKASQVTQRSGSKTRKGAAKDASTKRQTKKSRSRSRSSNKSAISVTDKNQQTKKSRSRSRSTNKSAIGVTDKDQQSDVITTIEDVINQAKENYAGAIIQTTAEIHSVTPSKKNKASTPKKPNSESGKKDKASTPKKPSGESGKKNKASSPKKSYGVKNGKKDKTESPIKPDGKSGKKDKTESPKKPNNECGKKNKTQSSEKPYSESGSISTAMNVSGSLPKEKSVSPKKPVLVSHPSREEYFPSSDSDSSCENVPLSSLLAAKKAANSKKNINASKSLDHSISDDVSINDLIVDIPDFEVTNDKPSEIDDEYVPSKSELQFVSGETEARSTRSSSKSKPEKVSQVPKKTVIPKLPPKSEFRSSGKLQAMYRSMLNTSREEGMESDEDSSENETNESLEDSKVTTVEPPRDLASNNLPSETLLATPSLVKTAKKTVEKNPVKNTSNVNSARGAAVLNTINNSLSGTIKQRKNPPKSDVDYASKKDVRTGNSTLNFVPSVSSLRKSPKDSVQSLNLTTFASEEVMEKLLKGSTSASPSQQSTSKEKSTKEVASKPSSINTVISTNQELNPNKADLSTSESNLSFQNELNESKTTEKLKTNERSDRRQIEYEMSQSLSQRPISSPHETQSSSSFACPRTTSRKTVKVLPPPKKRIRPVPCTSQYSPFLTFSSPEQTTSLDLSSVPQTPALPSLSGGSNLPGEPAPKTTTSPSVPNVKPLSGKPREILGPQTPALPSLSGGSNLLGEPAPKTTTSPSVPKGKPLSGKPRAMMEFYKQLKPNMKDGVPISPESMSSSSCTFDTFAARCLAKSKAVKFSENEPLNLVSPAKRMDSVNIGVKRKLVSSNFEESWENDLVLSPDKVFSKEPTNTEESASKENSAQEIVQSSESSSLCKSSEEGVIISPVKKESMKTDQDRAKKKMKLSETEPSVNFSKNDPVIPDDDSFEEGMIIDSPCKETDRNPELGAHAVEAGRNVTESSPNPVDFSQNRNRSSPVRSTAFVEHAPHQFLRKKFELNPKFPAGVKFPQGWNNSKLSHYSQAIEKNAPSGNAKQNDPMHSKGAKTKKQSSKARLKTPEKKNSFNRKSQNSHSSHRRSSDSRFSSRSRYDSYRSSYYRSPGKHRYSSYKSARKSYPHYRKNVHGERLRSVSQGRLSPKREKLPNRGGSDHDAKQHSFRSSNTSKASSSHSNPDEKRLKRYTPQINKKQGEDSIDSSSKIRDSGLNNTKPDGEVDAEVNAHSENEMNSKVREKQISEDKCSSEKLHGKKSSDRKAAFCAGGKDLPNKELNDSGERLKSSFSGKLTLSSEDKKSSEGHEKRSKHLQKLTPSENTSSEFERSAAVTKVSKTLEAVRETCEVDKGGKVNTSNSKEISLEPDSTKSSGENESLKNKKDSVTSKDCIVSNSELKKIAVSETPKQGRKRKMSHPTKKTSNVPSQQTFHLATQLEEKAVSSGSKSENLEKSIKSDEGQKPPSISNKNKKLSSCTFSKSNAGDLNKPKEKIEASAVVIKEHVNECTSIEKNKEKKASDHKIVAPISSQAKEGESSVQGSGVVKKESKRRKVSEPKKSKKKSNAEASIVLDASCNQITNVSDTLSISPPDTSHQKKHSRKIQSDSAVQANSGHVKTKPKGKAKKKPAIGAIKEQSKTEQMSATSEFNLNVSEISTQSDSQLSRTSTDQHELEEAVASICSRFGSQDSTPTKNADRSNWSEASASNAYSVHEPTNPDPESIHSASSESSVKEEKEKVKDMANVSAIFSKIKKFGMDNILDLIRRKSDGFKE